MLIHPGMAPSFSAEACQRAKSARFPAFSTILSEQVQTPCPVVHGEILARRDLPIRMKELSGARIGTTDRVRVNLYSVVQIARTYGAGSHRLCNISWKALKRCTAMPAQQECSREVAFVPIDVCSQDLEHSTDGEA